MRPVDWSGRVVVVTGASSGIGLATSLRLAAAGASVVLAARSEASLVEAEKRCAASDVPTLVVPTDVSDGKAVDALMAAARDRFGRVDAVVHAAAVLAYGRFTDVPAEVFDQVQATNILGTANVARSALEVFTAQEGGRLVVVGSVLGKITAPFMSSYATSKWAVHGLVRTLQIEARQTPGVDVTLVSPGGVDTPIYQQAGNYAGRVGKPPPPVDPPEYVAQAILGALERPRREVSVGLANTWMVTGFRMLPSTFDWLVTPLMTRIGLSDRLVAEHPGNVTHSRPEGNALSGGWTSLAGLRKAMTLGASGVARVRQRRGG